MSLVICERAMLGAMRGGYVWLSELTNQWKRARGKTPVVRVFTFGLYLSGDKPTSHTTPSWLSCGYLS